MDRRSGPPDRKTAAAPAMAACGPLPGTKICIPAL